MTRPVHNSLSACLLVGVGGAVGTGIRIWVGGLIPSSAAFPLSTFVINVTGALLLGLLYGLSGDAHTGGGRAQRLRLLLGTGLLGGYTTYSMFAVGTDGLILEDQFVASIAYALPTVILGVVAAAAGSSAASVLLGVGRRTHRGVSA